MGITDKITYYNLQFSEETQKENAMPENIHFAAISKKPDCPLLSIEQVLNNEDIYVDALNDFLYISKQIDERIKEQYPVLKQMDKNDMLLNLLAETINNAEIHGNKLDNTKTTHVEYSVNKNNSEPDCIYFELGVTDEGKGFNHQQIKDIYEKAVLLGYPVEAFGINSHRLETPLMSNGIGISMMLRYCDEVSWNDKGNKIILKKKFTSNPSLNTGDSGNEKKSLSTIITSNFFG